MKCNRDCFNCVFDDCIDDSVYPEETLYKYRSEEWKAHQREYQKKRREEAKKNGMCIICKKKEATKGAKCLECYLRQKRHDKKKNTESRERWSEEGLCYYCGAKPMDGKKVCEKHYESCVKRITRLNESDRGKEIRKAFGKYMYPARTAR